MLKARNKDHNGPCDGFNGEPRDCGVWQSNHTSLMHGWVPGMVQAVAVTVLLLAVGWRSRRWRLLWLPAAAAARRRRGRLGALVHRPPAVLPTTPHRACCGGGSPVSGAAVAVVVLGWRSAALVAARRIAAGRAAVSAQRGTGAQPVGRLLPHRADRVEPAHRRPAARPDRRWPRVSAMAASGAQPAHGSVVPVTIPDDASHFKHRGELVYLPPAWFASTPPPQLPTVMMIGGEFNTPARLVARPAMR